MKISFLMLLALLGAASWSPLRSVAAEPALTAYQLNDLLKTGVNLGNALDAPNEGEWGLTLEESYFEAIKQAGFTSVRIPVRWSTHAMKEAPYTIEPKFMARVDWAIEQARSRGLAVVLNMHHYDEIYPEPKAHTARFLGLWQRLAEHYQSQPQEVLFEILNEPNGALNDEEWNKLLVQSLAIIRVKNPTRGVVIGPGNWNNASKLEKLELPAGDRRLIVTFHDYSPHEFTHQGAEWAPGSQAWLGKTWTGTPDELKAMRGELDKAVEWGKKQDRPLYLGEFGVYSKAAMESRVAWTSAMVREAESRGISWCYWEFGSGFGVYDPAAKSFRQPLLEALLGKPKTATK